MGSAESNLASNLVRTATSMPDQPALKVNGQDLTYQQLHGMAARLAGALRARGVAAQGRKSSAAGLGSLRTIGGFPLGWGAWSPSSSSMTTRS